MALEKKDENEEEEKIGLLNAFVDKDEVAGLISQLVNSRCTIETIQLESDEIKFKTLMDKYQEQPHLLDPHLDWMLEQLILVGRSKETPLTVMHQAFKYLALVTKTRGFKIVVRHLPHEVSDMEPVLKLLLLQDAADRSTWETRYMLLLWLSIIVIIPFHLSRFDGTLVGEGIAMKPLAQRLLEVAQLYLGNEDKTQNAAAYLISKFVTRPDAKDSYFPQFLDWVVRMIKEHRNGDYHSKSLLTGILMTLALLYKHGKREDLLPYTGTILDVMINSEFKQSSNTQLRKLSIKILQRLGLTFLKPRVVSWRYERGMRSLVANLDSSIFVSEANSGIPCKTEINDEDYDVAEEIETVLENLLNGLKDRDNVVRWSAAKGIGRVTGRLPKELADEVVESVLELFTLRDCDDAWHGGCLALAELGRRGLLLPERLKDVVPFILRALVYDVHRGNFSVGSTIRDAACYVCWSFARAYNPEELAPYVCSIASSLLIVTIFDREVNCRRAAAAAFQENVGRQGTFPHGIDILTTADYFSVGSRTNCYLQISVYVAQFPEYTKPLINHLVERKINHWDKTVRELAAKSLHKLTACAPPYMIRNIIPRLLELVTDIDLLTRHGSLLALGEVVYGLAISQWENGKVLTDDVDGDVLKSIEDVVTVYQTQKMFRGIGGELMREAINILMENLALARIPITSNSTLEVWHEVIDESLAYDSSMIQPLAVKALVPICNKYYREVNKPSINNRIEMMVGKYIDNLNASMERLRIGFAQALGSLPKHILINHLEKIVNKIAECCRTDVPEEKDWTDLRKASVIALSSICKTVGLQSDGNKNEYINADNFCAITTCCLEGMNDYTTNNKGDVGAVVREASITALKDVINLAIENEPELVTPKLIGQFMALLAKISEEKIDRTRQHAVGVFLTLLHNSPAIPFIPYYEKLLEIFPKEICASLDFKSPAETFPLFTQLLAYPEYSYSVLLGLTASMGGQAESQLKYSSTALFVFLKSIFENEEEIQRFGETLLEILKNHQKVPRVSIPFLNLMDQLLASGYLSGLIQDPNCEFSSNLFTLLQNEVNRSKDPVKVMAATSVYCGLFQSHELVRKKALTQVAICLCHQYPRVRKDAADKLYEALITFDNVCNKDAVDEILEVVTETSWDDPLPSIRPVRNNLCRLLDIPAPKLIKKT